LIVFKIVLFATFTIIYKVIVWNSLPPTVNFSSLATFKRTVPLVV